MRHRDHVSVPGCVRTQSSPVQLPMQSLAGASLYVRIVIKPFSRSKSVQCAILSERTVQSCSCAQFHTCSYWRSSCDHRYNQKGSKSPKGQTSTKLEASTVTRMARQHPYGNQNDIYCFSKSSTSTILPFITCNGLVWSFVATHSYLKFRVRFTKRG